MKAKLLLASLFSIAVIGSAQATTHEVRVQNFSFTPNDMTIALGDTVKYTWINGDHTTTSTTIPAGAASWDNPMDASNTTFIYVPTVAGVYNYQCTPHAAMGHIGKFTVTGTSDIANYELAKSVFDVYPNPATSEITLSFSNNKEKVSSITIADITGKTVQETSLSKASTLTLDVRSLSAGTYFVRVIQDGQSYVRKFVVSK